MITRHSMNKSSVRTPACLAFFALLLVAWIGHIVPLHGQEKPLPDSQSRAAGAVPEAAKPALTCVDPLYKVFRTATDLPSTEAAAEVAVGEFATIQFVFRSPTAVSDLKEPSPAKCRARWLDSSAMSKWAIPTAERRPTS
jgi:hypothetical protein